MGIEGQLSNKARGVIPGIVLAVTVRVRQREDEDEAMMMGLIIGCVRSGTLDDYREGSVWLRCQ